MLLRVGFSQTTCRPPNKSGSVTWDHHAGTSEGESLAATIPVISNSDQRSRRGTAAQLQWPRCHAPAGLGTLSKHDECISSRLERPPQNSVLNSGPLKAGASLPSLKLFAQFLLRTTIPVPLPNGAYFPSPNIPL